ncbi:alkaline phosphatase D family protein [Stutzerimonas zhaodongensis]|uniref:Alkaline phosphatase D family protein n=1 Tax=Stutzerimonas zhaodongensis TaxID=1176257 RepID=A0A365PVN1_9GAMM|nr:alkaline phosphatase D family protein [Stutzerimonas zhaodongensis]QWV18850.1 alkaline phosphatase D family protein [Stutzerimonas zhaodongensis]RBA59437.1 hypothetical protein DQ403_09200 [Stutzerimonas zhaodongensis]
MTESTKPELDQTRRRLVQGIGAGLALPALGVSPAIIAAPTARPWITDGVQSGDVLADRAVIWSRCDRPARLVVEWDTSSGFNNARRMVSPVTDERLDFTARIDLRGLPSDQSIFYRASFEDARDHARSEPWKVIAADMPIGLHVPDGKDAAGRARWEAIANGQDGPAAGRELEIAELLGYLRKYRVRNTVWLTADVHYCAAHHYHPNRALFQDFDPFWEFVAGPLNAGSFGPNPLDATFGPELVFQKAPAYANASPYAGFQFFGEVEIDSRSGALSVTLRDIDGASVFSKTLEPQHA